MTVNGPMFVLEIPARIAKVETPIPQHHNLLAAGVSHKLSDLVGWSGTRLVLYRYPRNDERHIQTLLLTHSLYSLYSLTLLTLLTLLVHSTLFRTMTKRLTTNCIYLFFVLFPKTNNGSIIVICNNDSEATMKGRLRTFVVLLVSVLLVVRFVTMNWNLNMQQLDC